MVMPFLSLLGYNIFDPHEVVPEHHADFSEKYKNRVDYAIFRDGAPIIAIEVKAAGAPLEQDRGQLRSYFNACPSVKLGILTNGTVYECYADTDEPNIMDQSAFLAFDLREIAEDKLDTRTVQGIEDLRRDRFDPANVGNEARRKLLLREFVKVISRWQVEPSDGAIRQMLSDSGYEGRMTSRVIEECRELVRQAFGIFVDRAILKRVGLSEKVASESTTQAGSETNNEAASLSPSEPEIHTTEGEMRAFTYALRRLAFLVKDEKLFREIDHIGFQDHKTVFRVFYKKPHAGGLFTLKEGRDGKLTFSFPALDNKVIETNDLSEIDESLLRSFQLRVGSR